MQDTQVKAFLATYDGFAVTQITSFDVENSERISLSDILIQNAPRRFYLSPKAARGILRRAAKRGRTLPTALMHALTELAKGTTLPTSPPRSTAADTTEDSGPNPEGTLSHTVCDPKATTPARMEPDGERRLSPCLRGENQRNNSNPTTEAAMLVLSTSSDVDSLAGTTPTRHSEPEPSSAKGTPQAETRQGPSSVRRLIPLECERLQAFPDHWTCVPSVKKAPTRRGTKPSETP